MCPRTLLGAFALACFCVVTGAAHAEQAADDLAVSEVVPLQFEGRVIVEFSGDGRTVRLLEPYTYIAHDGERWDVPAQTVVDGASIPQVFWSIIGGPFEGRYRNASVVHDYYCDQKSRPWQRVHRMFYDAMMESGVDQLVGKTMYYAVYVFGPRWETIETQVVSVKCPNEGDCELETSTVTATVALPTVAYDPDKVQQDIELILDTNPSLEEIENLAME